MAILVTGGAGYIGSHVVRQLSQRGENVIVVDNLTTGFPEALTHGEPLVRVDVTDAQKLAGVFEKYSIDTVLHFAASLIVPESVTYPLKYYQNNTVGMVNLLNCCVKNKIKNFIFSSTAAVYHPPESGFCSEDSLLGSSSPYGTSKAMAEHILTDVSAAEKINYVILRYFNVAGAEPQRTIGQRTRNATHLIKVCCQAALGIREQVEIYGDDYPTRDGTGVRDYVHVEDLASVHLLALDYIKKNSADLILNVGYGIGNSVKEVISTAKKITGVNFKVKITPRRAGDVPLLVAQTDKIKEILRWKPKYASLEKIILDSFEWEKKLINKTEAVTPVLF